MKISSVYHLWVEDKEGNESNFKEVFSMKRALKTARSLFRKDKYYSEYILVRGTRGLYILNDDLKLYKIGNSRRSKRISYTCLPYKYFKKDLYKRYTKEKYPRLQNNSYYGHITNKFKNYSNYELYNEFMRLVKYLHENRYKIVVEKSKYDDFLYCVFSKECIRGSFCTKGAYYGNTDGRVAIDHVDCFDKWSRCPISINLKDLNFKVLEEQIEYMKSKEEFDFSNEYFDSSKFINDYHTSDEYVEYVLRNKIARQSYRALLKRDILCPYCNIKTVNITKLEEGAEYVYDSRIDECPECKRNYTVCRNKFWVDEESITYEDNFTDKLDVSFEGIEDSLGNISIQEYYNLIKRDVSCPVCNTEMCFNDRNPLERFCSNCDKGYSVYLDKII